MLNVKLVSSVSLGNFLEWYEFGLFSAFAPLFARLFFPTADHHIAVISVFAVFAIGFLCRPIGGIIFGHFGDKIGRVKTLRASILLITGSTFLMAFLPTYTQAGMYATISLVTLRLLQGISLGGEFTGIIIYLTEVAPEKRRAFVASFAGTAANLGLLSATAAAFILQQLLSSTHYYSYGWRLAFLLGGSISAWVMYSRWDLLETSVFKNILLKNKIVAVPLLKAFREIPGTMLRTVGLVMFGSVLYYTCYIYLQEYLVDVLHFSSLIALKVQMACIVSMLFLVPLGGIICDRLGRRRAFLLMTASLLVGILPCFYLLNSLVLGKVILAMAIFTLISSLEQGTTSATVVEQFPPALRYSGISLSYNLTQAIFGGTAPVVAAFLVLYTHNAAAPAYYLLFVAALSFMTALFSLVETAPRYQKVKNIGT